MRTFLRRILLGVLALGGLGSHAQAEDTLQLIKEHGVVSIGVKADSKPWAFLDASGAPVGSDIDLAKQIAERLGVKLRLIIVQSSNRIQFLQQGRVDLLVATMDDNAERRRVIDMVQPHYFSSGTNIIALKRYHFTKWEQLKDKDVCGQQGSTFNKWLAQTYGAEIVALPSIEEAYSGLRAGNCVAFVYNDTLLTTQLRDPTQWGDYEVPLTSEFFQNYSIGMRKGELDTPLGKMLSDLVIEDHKSGQLLKWSKTWGFPPNAFLEAEHQKYSK